MSSAAGSAGAARLRLLPGRRLSAVDLGYIQDDDARRQAVRQVDFGAVDGQRRRDPERRQRTADRNGAACRRQRLVARGDAEIGEFRGELRGWPQGSAQHQAALRLERAARTIARRQRGELEAVALAHQIGFQIGQRRTAREILIMRIRQPQLTARRWCCDRAADRHIGGELAAQPVFAERQQIGEVADLARSLQAEGEPSLRRHGNPDRRRVQQQRQRAGKRHPVAAQPGHLASRRRRRGHSNRLRPSARGAASSPAARWRATAGPHSA